MGEGAVGQKGVQDPVFGRAYSDMKMRFNERGEEFALCFQHCGNVAPMGRELGLDRVSCMSGAWIGSICMASLENHFASGVALHTGIATTSRETSCT